MLREDAAIRMMELEQTVSEEFREALKIAGYLLMQGFRDDLRDHPILFVLYGLGLEREAELFQRDMGPCSKNGLGIGLLEQGPSWR